MAGQIHSLSSAAASGVEGMRKAANLQNRAAVAVQGAFHGSASSSSASAGGAATVNVSSASQDLAGAFTDMMRADGLNKASVAVVKTADEMTQELLNIKG